jgi:hypothetical protein
MKESQLIRAQEQCLRDQVITADQPGPVLRDFRLLLEFLGSEGVEAGGKYNLLPLKFIGELDRRLSRPLHLELKRPQLRSHPYLQGLNLLLRASGLSRVEGASAKAHLAVHGRAGHPGGLGGGDRRATRQGGDRPTLRRRQVGGLGFVGIGAAQLAGHRFDLPGAAPGWGEFPFLSTFLQRVAFSTPLARPLIGPRCDRCGGGNEGNRGPCRLGQR